MIIMLETGTYAHITRKFRARVSLYSGYDSTRAFQTHLGRLNLLRLKQGSP